MSDKELIILTGVSGAGKSTAMNFMEDIGFYCVDNMPPQLISTFINLLSTRDEYSKVAIVADVRSIPDFKELVTVFDTVKELGFIIKIIYLDIKTDAALKRYKLTRRKHPLADKYNGDIEQAILNEKKSLSALRGGANFIVDTTEITPAQLKERLSKILLVSGSEAIQVHCTSFGFKYGIASEADFVLDVRCLPNPYWIDELKEETGMDKGVVDYIFASTQSDVLFQKLSDMADFLLPLYVKEGKSQVVFAIGCTGGRHRSVAFAERLGKHLSNEWKNVAIHHRDISK